MNETKDKGAEHLSKVIMAANFSNLRREIHIHIHEAQRIPNKINFKEDYTEKYYNLVKSQGKRHLFKQGIEN